MPESKNLNWAKDYATEADVDTKNATQVEQAGPAGQPAANDAQPAANDSDGWQQYRQWISKAPAPRGRRVGIDPALYSWKGYRSWTEQIRRNWEPDSEDGSE